MTRSIARKLIQELILLNSWDMVRHYISLAQISHSVVSNSLRPHESQHARPPCPSPIPRVYSNSRPSSRWCHPTISSSVIPFSCCPNPSQHQGLFQWVSSSQQVAKVLEFQFQHQSSNEHPGLISFRMNCLDLLVVQGTLKSLFQHHRSKASIFRRSASHSLNSATSWRVTGLDKWTRWLLLRVSRVNYPLNTFVIKVGYEELKLTTIDPKLLCKSSTTPEFKRVPWEDSASSVGVPVGDKFLMLPTLMSSGNSLLKCLSIFWCLWNFCDV